jgi:hypothetical protein
MAGQYSGGAVVAAFLLSRSRPPTYEEALCVTDLITFTKR